MGPMRIFPLLLLLLLLLVPVSVYASATGGDDSDNFSWMLDQLHGLSRTSFSGASISGNIQDYDILTCNDKVNSNGETERECEQTEMSPSDVGSNSADDDSLAAYIQGLTTYGLINFIIAFIIGIYAALFLLLSCCGLNLCFCCPSTPDNWDDKQKNHFAWATTACLSTLLTFVFICIACGLTLGYGNNTELYTVIPEAPEGYVYMLRNQMPIVENLITSVSYEVLRPALRGLNTSITDNVDFVSIIYDLDTMDTLLGELRDSDVSRDVLGCLEDNTDRTISAITALSSDINEISEELAALSATSKAMAAGVETDSRATTEAEFDAFLASYYALGLGPVRADIVELSSIFPPMTACLVEMIGIAAKTSSVLTDFEPPLEDLMTVQIPGINATLMDTSKFFDSNELYDDIEVSLDSAIEATNNAVVDMNNSIIAINEVNFTEYLRIIDDGNRSIEAACGQIPLKAVRTALASDAAWDAYPDKTPLADSLEEVAQACDDMQMDLVRIKGTLDDSSAELDSIDFKEVEGSFDDQDKLVNDNRGSLQDLLLLVKGFKDYLYEPSLLRLALRRLTKSYLMEVGARQGVGQVVMSLGYTLDSMSEYFHSLSLNLTSDLVALGVKRSSFREDMVDIAELLDRLSSSHGRDKDNLAVGGALYYLMRISNSTAAGVLDIDSLVYQTLRGSVSKDTNGAAYPDDQLCVTSACLAAEEQQSEYYHIMGLLYLPLVLILMAGIAALPLPYMGSDYHRSAKYLTYSFCTCVVLFVPLLLVLTGILLPLLIGGSDVCQGGVSGTINLYMTEMGGSFCTDMGGKSGGLQDCVFEVIDKDLVLNVQGLLGTFVGVYDDSQCNGLLRGDPYKDMFEQLSIIVKEASSEWAGNITGDADLKVSSNVSSIIEDMGSHFGACLAEALALTGERSLNCPLSPPPPPPRRAEPQLPQHRLCLVHQPALCVRVQRGGLRLVRCLYLSGLLGPGLLWVAGRPPAAQQPGPGPRC